MAPLKIFEINEDGELQFHLDRFNKVVDLIPPKVPIGIMSIIGTKRLGKSFVMNCLLRYFKDPSTSMWFQSELQENFFESSSGSERVTVGIDIWSEPIYLQVFHKKVALLVLDCQGEYDRNTDTQGNTVIFALTHLLSSFMIYNLQSQVDERVLQQFVYLSQYVKKINLLAPGVSHSGPNLLFLLRDFQFEGEFGLGFSGPGVDTVNGVENYYEYIFGEIDDMPQENRSVRRKLHRIFRKIGIYMMPHPGKPFILDGEQFAPEPDFQRHMNELAENVMNNVESKKMGNVDMTKESLGELLEQLSMLCQEKQFPTAESIAEMYRNLDESRRLRELEKEQARRQRAQFEEENQRYWTNVGFVAGGALAGVGTLAVGFLLRR